MKKNLSPKHPKTAFSLLELSIVIIIISILIVGSMSASMTAINNAKYKVTRDRMAEIYKAMGNYLLINKALPCPASLKNMKSDSATGANYGVAAPTATPGTCALDGVFIGGMSSSLAYGMIPVQALGLNADMAEDGFGNRFTYIVSKGFTDVSVASTSSGFGSVSPASGFTVPTAGFITLKESLGNSVFQTNTNDAVFAIISHGANKYGAFNNNALTQNAASADADEQENYGTSFVDGGGTADTVTISSYLVPSAVNSDVFDDVIFYKTRNNLLLDYSAMSLIVCPAIAANTDTSYVIAASPSPFAWPQSYYGQVVASTVTCSSVDASYTTTVTYPTKRCGAFGVWQSGAINPCTN